MTYDELIAKYGTQVKAAAAIGITKGAVAHWKRIGYIPILRQYQIQRISRGRLKAEEPV